MVADARPRRGACRPRRELDLRGGADHRRLGARSGTSFRRRRTLRRSMAPSGARHDRTDERRSHRRLGRCAPDPLRAAPVNALLRHRFVTPGWFGARRARPNPEAADRHAPGDRITGRQHPFTLRFLDPELERRYQWQAGREGLAGFRIITGTAALAWPLAALVIPLGTPIPREL